MRRKTQVRFDQLFKEAIKCFFREFMELFFAEIARRLDFSRVTFLDKEGFTDLPKGRQRTVDLLVQVYTLDGNPEIILVHFEIESRRRSVFPPRMFEYYMLIKLRYQLPIFPIAVYLSPGAGGLSVEQHMDQVFGQDVIVFRYSAVGLPDLYAEEYLMSDNPLGIALSSLMKPGTMGRVAQKYAAVRKMALSSIDDARKALLTNVIEQSLQLAGQDQIQYEELIAAPEGKEIRQMISVYEQRGIEIGIEQGIEQGIERGIEKGIEQGIEKGIEQGIAEGLMLGILRGKRQTLLRLMHLKFGNLPANLPAHIELIDDAAELDRLCEGIFGAKNVEALLHIGTRQ